MRLTYLTIVFLLFAGCSSPNKEGGLPKHPEVLPDTNHLLYIQDVLARKNYPQPSDYPKEYC